MRSMSPASLTRAFRGGTRPAPRRARRRPARRRGRGPGPPRGRGSGLGRRVGAVRGRGCPSRGRLDRTPRGAARCVERAGARRRDVGEAPATAAFGHLDETFRLAIAPEPVDDWLATSYPTPDDLAEGRRLRDGLNRGPAVAGRGAVAAPLRDARDERPARRGPSRPRHDRPPNRRPIGRGRARRPDEGGRDARSLSRVPSPREGVGRGVRRADGRAHRGPWGRRSRRSTAASTRPTGP